MNIFYRVDNRLVHGQIISTWMPHLRPKVRHRKRLRTIKRASNGNVSNGDPERYRTQDITIGRCAGAQRTQTHSNVCLGPAETVEDAAKLFGAGHAFSMLNIGNVSYAWSTIVYQCCFLRR